MLVVVHVVTGVAVVPVDVIDVVPVGDDRMAAAILVHVHVPRVRDVRDWIGGFLVYVITVDEVDVAVVQEVDVTLVRHRRMPAARVMDVRMLVGSKMLSVASHRYLHPPR